MAANGWVTPSHQVAPNLPDLTSSYESTPPLNPLSFAPLGTLETWKPSDTINPGPPSCFRCETGDAELALGLSKLQHD